RRDDDQGGASRFFPTFRQEHQACSSASAEPSRRTSISGTTASPAWADGVSSGAAPAPSGTSRRDSPTIRYETPHRRADECPHAGVGKACRPERPSSVLSTTRRTAAMPLVLV